MRYTQGFDAAALESAKVREVHSEEFDCNCFAIPDGQALVFESGTRLYLCGPTEALARDPRGRFWLIRRDALSNLGLV